MYNSTICFFFVFLGFYNFCLTVMVIICFFLDVFVDGCINGGCDVPAGILECVLMANCFRRSMS